MAVDRSPRQQQVVTDAGATLTVWRDPSVGATVPQMFWSLVRRRAAQVALRQWRDGEWQAIGWAELGGRVRRLGLGLKALGFGRHDVAAVLAAPSADWLAADLAVQAVAGACAGIDPGVSPRRLREIVEDSGAKVLFVDDATQLDKARDLPGAGGHAGRRRRRGRHRHAPGPVADPRRPLGGGEGRPQLLTPAQFCVGQGGVDDTFMMQSVSRSV